MKSVNIKKKIENIGKFTINDIKTLAITDPFK